MVSNSYSSASCYIEFVKNLHVCQMCAFKIYICIYTKTVNINQCELHMGHLQETAFTLLPPALCVEAVCQSTV